MTANICVLPSAHFLWQAPFAVAATVQTSQGNAPGHQWQKVNERIFSRNSCAKSSGTVDSGEDGEQWRGSLKSSDPHLHVCVQLSKFTVATQFPKPAASRTLEQGTETMDNGSTVVYP